MTSNVAERDDALCIDLLKADEYRRYLEQPELLREELTSGTRPAQVVIVEVQKVPAMLDEVHWLHEHRVDRRLWNRNTGIDRA